MEDSISDYIKIAVVNYVTSEINTNELNSAPLVDNRVVSEIAFYLISMT